MKDVLPDIDRWVARGDAIALATVVAVKKSAPRPPGAQMAVSASACLIRPPRKYLAVWLRPVSSSFSSRKTFWPSGSTMLKWW